MADPARMMVRLAAQFRLPLGMAALAAAFEAHGNARAAESASAAMRAVAPAATRVVPAGDTTLNLLDTGAGPPIVLLHGNGATGLDFVLSGLVDRLRHAHRVIVPDRPGYGLSPRPHGSGASPFEQAALLRSALRRVGVVRPVIVGHSWGTLPALAWALDEPEAIAGLALISGYYYPERKPALGAARIADLPLFAGPMRRAVLGLLGLATGRAVLRRIFAPQPVPPSYEGAPLGLAMRPSQLQASLSDAAIMPRVVETMAPRYRDLHCPVLLVAGEADRIVDTARQTLRLHAELPDAVLLSIPGAGHMVHHAAPDQVALAVRRLSRGTLARRSPLAPAA